MPSGVADPPRVDSEPDPTLEKKKLDGDPTLELQPGSGSDLIKFIFNFIYFKI